MGKEDTKKRRRTKPNTVQTPPAECTNEQPPNAAVPMQPAQYIQVPAPSETSIRFERIRPGMNPPTSNQPARHADTRPQPANVQEPDNGTTYYRPVGGVAGPSNRSNIPAERRGPAVNHTGFPYAQPTRQQVRHKSPPWRQVDGYPDYYYRDFRNNEFMPRRSDYDSQWPTEHLQHPRMPNIHHPDYNPYAEDNQGSYRRHQYRPYPEMAYENQTEYGLDHRDVFQVPRHRNMVLHRKDPRSYYQRCSPQPNTGMGSRRRQQQQAMNSMKSVNSMQSANLMESASNMQLANVMQTDWQIPVQAAINMQMANTMQPFNNLQIPLHLVNNMQLPVQSVNGMSMVPYRMITVQPSYSQMTDNLIPQSMAPVPLSLMQLGYLNTLQQPTLPYYLDPRLLQPSNENSQQPTNSTLQTLPEQNTTQVTSTDGCQDVSSDTSTPVLMIDEGSL